MGQRVGVPRRSVEFVFAIVLGLVLAAPAIAQEGTGSIAGLITDESGGVLPGVTATAKSPALQVAEVTALTDERGEYRLTPLPIGTYTVEYTLPGFQTIRREDILLSNRFTARVDITMKVGGLEETVTVSGASPVVDAAATAATTQLTKETLELIPTSRNGYVGLMAQAPGARPNFDVGGDTVNSVPAFRAFGQSGESYQAFDGVSTVNPKGSESGNYTDYATFEEATIQTIGHDASVPNRGVAINTVIKTGGNDFHGAVFYAGTNHNFQGENIDDELRAQGINEGDTLELRDDFSSELGGRIVRDKLWFWTGVRLRRNTENALECFKPDGSICQNYERGWFMTGKLTYQLNASNRLLGSTLGNTRYNLRGATRLVSSEARTNQKGWNGAGKFEWQNVRSNSMVISVLAGGWWNHSGSYNDYDDWVDKISTMDRVTGVVTGTVTNFGERNREERPNFKGSLSWFKPNWLGGNHEIKTGFDYFFARANRNRLGGDRQYTLQLQFRNAVPDRISVGNNPVKPDASIKYLGVYLQDSWTIGRKLTLNLGVRHAYDNGYVNERCRDAATPPGDVANPAECFPEVQFVKFHPWSPRLRASYDLFGDGKTVVKGGWGRYHRMRYSNDLLTASRNVITTTLYTWRDPNGNHQYDYDGEVNLAVNSPDFLSKTLSGQGGALANGVANPDEAEPLTDEFMIQFERELMPNVGFRATGAYSRAHNQYRFANPLRPYEVYNIPIPNADPGPDGVLGTGDDTGNINTYFDYPATYAGLAFQQPMMVNDDKATQTYRSVEFAMAKRLSNRWQLSASYSATKIHDPLVTNAGDFNSVDPNAEIFAARDTWEWMGRLSGAYLMPHGFLVSANYEHRSGEPWARTALYTGAIRVGSLTLRVEPIGTQRYDNLNLLDLRVEKSFSFRTTQKMSVRLNVFNALNINTVLTTNEQSGPSFGRAVTIVQPRILELSGQYSF